MEIHKPPQLKNHNGHPRRIGYELEFSGLEIGDIVNLVSAKFPGEVIRLNPYKYAVQHASYGSFRIEMDAYLLNEMVIQGYLDDLGIRRKEEGAPVREFIDRVIKEVAETVVPYEVSTPPLPLEAMRQVEELKENLRMAGAKGTGHSMFYAFGLQLNPDIYSLEAGDLLAVLRSFLVLHPWLRKKLKIDLTRKITPFINSFPRNYIQGILQPWYNPDLPGLINDYLEYNKTRNRPLDFLPLFSHMEPGIKGRLNDMRVNARPAFHYRLPNSKVSLSSWSIITEWNYWVKVEELAGDKRELMSLCRDYLNFMKDPLYLKKDWINRIDQWAGKKEIDPL